MTSPTLTTQQEKQKDTIDGGDKNLKWKDDTLVTGSTRDTAVTKLKELYLSHDMVLFLPSGHFHLPKTSHFQGITYGDHIFKYTISSNEARAYKKGVKDDRDCVYKSIIEYPDISVDP